MSTEACRGTSCRGSASGGSPGPCLDVVLAALGHIVLTVFGSRHVGIVVRRLRRELRLAEQAFVRRLASACAALYVVHRGMAELNVDGWCVVDDETSFRDSGRSGRRPVAQRSESRVRCASRRRVPRCRHPTPAALDSVGCFAPRAPRTGVRPGRWCSVKLSMATRMPASEPVSSSA